MKEKQNVSGTAQPEEESKTKKYLRIALGSVGLVFFVLLIVMIIVRKCGT